MAESEIIVENVHLERHPNDGVLHLKVRVKHLCHDFSRRKRNKLLTLFYKIEDALLYQNVTPSSRF